MENNVKKIVILGSTGSIGRQTLDVAREQKDIEVVALCARRSVDLMEKQIREFRPKRAVMWEEDAAADLRVRVSDLDVEVLSGMEGILDTAAMDGYEYFVTAIMGMVGVRPTVAAIESGKKIALANKETLVTAGHIIMRLAAEKRVPILPVDSEHSAIFQSLNGEAGNRIAKIWLTASGGPFRGRTAQDLQSVRPADALRHPTWEMGRKITIDSSTLVNKGLEVIEAKWLFDVDPSQIQVLVHPQSIIHSMVEYEDGGIIAQLGVPDMRLPIQYALYYPERRPMPGEKLDFYSLGQITFEKPDMETFPALRLAYEAIGKGGNIPTAFNAADEYAVQQFLEEKISFPLEMHKDARGSFTELLKTTSCGQFSVNVSLPGITKGEHWHNSKWELFIVVSGHGLIRQRKLGTDEIIEYEVSGAKIEAVHMLPGYTHSITNLSENESLIIMMWANEIFDPEHPDTFSEMVGQ